MTQPEYKAKVVAQNRRARFDYFITDTMEAGIVLAGSEVKSLRRGHASINESYASYQGDELYLLNAFVPEYTEAHQFNHDPKRPRKLLLHRRQITKLLGAVKRKGVTLIPLSIYFNGRGMAKLELGIAEGKKKHDKREAIKERDWNRDKARILRDKG
jgi:SsrA-binding protein